MTNRYESRSLGVVVCCVIEEEEEHLQRMDERGESKLNHTSESTKLYHKSKENLSKRGKLSVKEGERERAKKIERECFYDIYLGNTLLHRPITIRIDGNCLVFII